MNNASLKQKALLAMVFVIALYAVAAGMWFLSSESAWKRAAKNYQSAKSTYARECALIERKNELAEEYEAKRSAMPMFEDGKATDTTWLKRVEEVAKRNLVLIGQYEAKQEIEDGEVRKLPIEVRNFEGSLEALVKFLYEIENSDDTMFSVSQLSFRPSSKKGYLKGNFTLNCAYMREK